MQYAYYRLVVVIRQHETRLPDELSTETKRTRKKLYEKWEKGYVCFGNLFPVADKKICCANTATAMNIRKHQLEAEKEKNWNKCDGKYYVVYKRHRISSNRNSRLSVPPKRLFFYFHRFAILVFVVLFRSASTLSLGRTEKRFSLIKL